MVNRKRFAYIVVASVIAISSSYLVWRGYQGTLDSRSIGRIYESIKQVDTSQHNTNDLRAVASGAGGLLALLVGAGIFIKDVRGTRTRNSDKPKYNR